ncbi:MAG: hypothetical protein M5U34_45855 [Chloroflexi bacterium]|nr:hypothetical protein [Chloroflexota bacterium]
MTIIFNQPESTPPVFGLPNFTSISRTPTPAPTSPPAPTATHKPSDPQPTTPPEATVVPTQTPTATLIPITWPLRQKVVICPDRSLRRSAHPANAQHRQCALRSRHRLRNRRANGVPGSTPPHRGPRRRCSMVGDSLQQ